MNLQITSLISLTKIFTEFFNKCATTTIQYFRANHANFVEKDLQRAIMLRSRLWNIFFKEKFLESKNAHNN